MSGSPRAIVDLEQQSRATGMPSFACTAMKAGSAAPTVYSKMTEASVCTLASLFVIVLLSALLLALLLLSCLTGSVTLHGLVGLITQYASAARQGV